MILANRFGSSFGFCGRALVRLSFGLCFGVAACSGSVEGDGAGGNGGQGGGGSGGEPGGNVVDGPCRVTSPMKRLTSLQYANSLKMAFDGKVSAATVFPPPAIGSSRTGFSTEPDANVVTTLGAENVLEASEQIALQVAEKIGDFVPCAAAGNESCAGQFLDKYGVRLYRRPLTSTERDRLLAVYKKAEGTEAWKDGIALMVSTMLQSPQFLYITEPGSSTDDTQVVKLGDYEVASRLSFLFWDSGPDQTLLDAAAAKKLQNDSDIRKQAERMLSDERAKATITRFAREWLALDDVNPADRKDLTEKLAEAQVREFEMFVDDAFRGEGTLKEFLTSRRTYLDKTAASSYGMDGAGLEEGVFKPVTLDRPERAGILTLPAVMTSKAHPDEPAYVFRGTFVLKKLMCMDLPSPPAGATQMLPVFPANATQRQKSDLIRQQEKCTGCHQLIDPIGLSFEAFDQLGRVRTKLPSGQAVDTRGEVFDVGSGLDGTFDSPRALAERMAESQDVSQCLAKQAFRFLFAKLEQDADACAIASLTKAFQEKDFRLRELLLQLPSVQGFRTRRLEDVK